MTQSPNDHAPWRRYLLGTTSPAETARLDELSLTDDECALALAAAENDLVDAYANASLTAAERAQFERHYLASPLRREKAQFAQTLQHLGAPAAIPLQHAPPRPAWPFTWFKLSPLWQAGLAAAALLLLAACLWLMTDNRRLRQAAGTERAALAQRAAELKIAAANNQDELTRARERLAQLTAPTPSVQLLTFTLAAPLRDATNVPKLTLPPQTAEVAIRLELESRTHPRYRVVLRNPLTGGSVWQSGSLAARGSYVSVRLPARLLAAQRYAFELSGVAANNAQERLSSYPFTVSKP